MTFVDLKKCPNCAYPKEGLPEPITCPECGCVYETDAQVLSFSPRPDSLAPRIVLPVLASLSAAGAATAIRVGRYMVFVLPLLALLVYLVLWIPRFRSQLRSRFVLLFAGGFTVVGRRPAPETFRWGAVDRIEQNGNSPSAHVYGLNGQELTVLRRPYLGSLSHALAFTLAARRWHARYKRKSGAS